MVRATSKYSATRRRREASAGTRNDMTGSSKKARARLAASGAGVGSVGDADGPGHGANLSSLPSSVARAGCASSRHSQADDLGDSATMARPVPFVHPVKVRYLEVDRQGVVFNMWYWRTSTTP